MKHKRQHTNGVVSKEERTNRIRQLLGSPTAMRLQHNNREESRNSNSDDVMNTCDVTTNLSSNVVDIEEKFSVKPEEQQHSLKETEVAEKVAYDSSEVKSHTVEPCGANLSRDICGNSEDSLIPNVESGYQDLASKDSNTGPILSNVADSDMVYYPPTNKNLSENVPDYSTQEHIPGSVPNDPTYSNYSGYSEAQCNCCYPSKCHESYHSNYQYYNYGAAGDEQYYYSGYEYSDYYDPNVQHFACEHPMPTSDHQVNSYQY